MDETKKDCFKSKSIIARLQKNDVLVFVGAHPDDETLLSPFLAYAADQCREVVVISMTKGEAGWNLFREDLSRTLAQVRQAEFEKAVRILNCTPLMLSYTNGVSRAHPQGLAVLELQEAAVNRWKTQGDKEEKNADVYARWTQECGDPACAILKIFEEKKATIIITMDPKVGCTGHVEHIAISEATQRAVLSYREKAKTTLAFYYLWRKTKVLPGAKINPVFEVPTDTELVVDGDISCAGGKDYLQIASVSFECYESQFGPMASERRGKEPAQRFGHEEWFLQDVNGF